MRRHGRHGPTKGSASPEMLSPLKAYDMDSNPSRPLRSSPLTASTIQGLPLELIDRLRSFPLFASAPAAFLSAIGKSLRPQLHQPQDPILVEGEDAKSMYWLVRGSVRVTSRDGESTYAELKPGAFFGEIGILMDIPRTATITASSRCLIVRLNKEDLQKELPKYPTVERVIREEAAERLAILEHKKKQGAHGITSGQTVRKRSRDKSDDIEMRDAQDQDEEGDLIVLKKRKSPSPTIAEAAASSVFGKSSTPIRQILQSFPLFSNLPADILHQLGINAEPCTFPPFTDIIRQGTQGREVYFIVQGEVEVLSDSHSNGPDSFMSGMAKEHSTRPVQKVRARFRQGQYFGEVASLQLAPVRTATVRSIDKVECLKITGESLDELWSKASPYVRQQMENEAKKRLDSAVTPLKDASEPFFTTPFVDNSALRIPPTVTFTDIGFDNSNKHVEPTQEPLDPDPFFGSELELPRAKSRRSSLAPPEEQDISNDHDSFKHSPLSGVGPTTSPRKLRSVLVTTPPSPLSQQFKVKPDSSRHSTPAGKGPLPDTILVLILQHFDLVELMRARAVSLHWQRLCTNHPDLLQTLNLSKFNRRVNDEVLINRIVPFAGSRPRTVDMNACFHIGDEGFSALVAACAPNTRIWRMRSVWDVTGNAILELVSKARYLEEIDLSNCRKVGDNLLARIVGWANSTRSANAVGLGIAAGGVSPTSSANNQGSPFLKRLTLSYCKHVQDRSMAHIAQYAAERLEEIDLTRCTSVTDNGFQQWGMHTFPVLRKLVLADCTYLTDQSIVAIANAAQNLRELDLSFCCALSDTATEVLSLGLTQLTHLDLAFCGSAVSDSSLRSIGLHLLDLRFLSVRGCVRVTGQGVEAVVDCCRTLDVFDISQCKNLRPWLAMGGIEALQDRGCTTQFELVANGSWRNVI